MGMPGLFFLQVALLAFLIFTVLKCESSSVSLVRTFRQLPNLVQSLSERQLSEV